MSRKILKNISFYNMSGTIHPLLMKGEGTLSIGGYLIAEVEEEEERNLVIKSIVYYCKPSRSLFISQKNFQNCSEEILRKYPYLISRFDPRIISRVKKRAHLEMQTRQFLASRGFTEVDTPLLGENTGETGARCSKTTILQREAYLPQSPQLYKQLLILGGLEKYFQFAKCIRDENLRNDRQFEFTQLDLEMALEEESIEPLISIALDLFSNLGMNFHVEIKTQAEILQLNGHPFEDCRYTSFLVQRAGKLFFSVTPNGNNVLRVREGLIPESTTVIRSETKLEFWCEEGIEQGEDWVRSLIEAIDVESENFSVVVITEMPSEGLSPFVKRKGEESYGFDILINGKEIASGGIREIDPEELRKNFNGRKEMDFFIEAMEYGAPVHGGFGIGWERLLSILEGGNGKVRDYQFFYRSKSGKGLS